MWDIFRNIFIAFFTLIILYWINKSVQNKKGKEDGLGKTVFKLTPFYKWFGYVSVSLSVIAVVVSFPFESQSDLIAIIILFCLFGGVGTLTIVYYYRVYFEMDEDEIQYKGIINPITIINWNEIETIKFSTWSSCLVFKNKSGLKVRAHMHLQGISQVIEMIEKKKGLTKKDIKFPY